MENEVQQQTEQDKPQAEVRPAPAAAEVRPARPSSEDREDRPRRRGRWRRRVCPMCENKISFVDYKDFNFLRRFISDRGRIESRRKSGACAKHQRALAQGIKRARHLALLPYTADHIRVSGVGYYR
jgi:small subunit ribosomal protein S18